MGRPPCCDKVGIKKGPWTPEEDIRLVSYIQQHGPGNWRSVPINTGLLRCSKSCRLRWTNYLRPGIKRGNFTSHEEGMIIHLQAILGNRWAAIATYLPQRTDNDIKNYWNTHLKKKINQLNASRDGHQKNLDATFIHRSAYASSTENISRLLEGWTMSSPVASNGNGIALATENQVKGVDDGLGSVLPFDNHNSISIPSWDKLNCESAVDVPVLRESAAKEDEQPPLCFLEKWLLGEASGFVDELMDVSNDCCSNTATFI